MKRMNKDLEQKALSLRKDQELLGYDLVEGRVHLCYQDQIKIYEEGLSKQIGYKTWAGAYERPVTFKVEKQENKPKAPTPNPITKLKSK